jgi:hypothetical protein
MTITSRPSDIFLIPPAVLHFAKHQDEKSWAPVLMTLINDLNSLAL